MLAATLSVPAQHPGLLRHRVLPEFMISYSLDDGLATVEKINNQCLQLHNSSGYEQLLCRLLAVSLHCWLSIWLKPVDRKSVRTQPDASTTLIGRLLPGARPCSRPWSTLLSALQCEGDQNGNKNCGHSEINGLGTPSERGIGRVPIWHRRNSPDQHGHERAGFLTARFYMLQIYDRVLPGHSIPTFIQILALILFVTHCSSDLIRTRLMVRLGAPSSISSSQTRHSISILNSMGRSQAATRLCAI